MKYPVIIKTYKSVIGFVVISFVAFFELVFWITYFLSLPECATDSFGIATYVLTPVFVILGISAYYLLIKLFNFRLECYEDKIILKRRNKVMQIFEIDKSLEIHFAREFQLFFTDALSKIEFGPGSVIFQKKTTNGKLEVKQVYMSYSDYESLVNLYPVIYK